VKAKKAEAKRKKKLNATKGGKKPGSNHNHNHAYQKKSTLISSNNKKHNSDIISIDHHTKKVEPKSAVPNMEKLGMSPTPKKIVKIEQPGPKYGHGIINIHKADSFNTDSDFNVSEGTETPPIF